MKQRRNFTPDFKAKVVLDVLMGVKSNGEACREHRLKPEVLSRWKADFVENAHLVFRSDEQRNQEQARIAELERMVGRLTVELEVAKKVSQSWGAAMNRGVL
jgi:transposase-like protein